MNYLRQYRPLFYPPDDSHDLGLHSMDPLQPACFCLYFIHDIPNSDKLSTPQKLCNTTRTFKIKDGNDNKIQPE